MFRWTLLPCLLVCAAVHAAPTTVAEDAVERLLTDKGLIERLGGQLEHVRHTAGEKASELVVNAMGFLGVPYKRGGTSAETGFDCSGFVRLVFKDSVGAQLPRTAAEMSQVGQRIDTSQLKPGDLVFFNTMRRTFSHVGIYLGDNHFLHAPRTGAEVRVENMEDSYWIKRYNGARRIIDGN